MLCIKIISSESYIITWADNCQKGKKFPLFFCLYYHYFDRTNIKAFSSWLACKPGLGTKILFNSFTLAHQNNFFCKQCGSWLDGSLAVSSGSTLFAILLWFLLLRPLFGTMVLTTFKNGSVHFRNPGMKELKLNSYKKKSHAISTAILLHVQIYRIVISTINWYFPPAVDTHKKCLTAMQRMCLDKLFIISIHKVFPLRNKEKNYISDITVIQSYDNDVLSNEQF